MLGVFESREEILSPVCRSKIVDLRKHCARLNVSGMAEKKICHLVGTDAETKLKPVMLTNQEAVILGRCPVTGILDKKLSRQQVEVKADFEGRVLHLKQLSSRPSIIGSSQIVKDQDATIADGGRFKLLNNKYEYKVIFPPPPAQNSQPNPSHTVNGSGSTTKRDKGDITDFFQKKQTKRRLSEEEPSHQDVKKKPKLDSPKKVTSERNYKGTVSDSESEDSQDSKDLDIIKGKTEKRIQQKHYKGIVSDSDDSDIGSKCPLTHAPGKKHPPAGSSDRDHCEDGISTAVKTAVNNKASKKATSKDYKGAVSDSDENDEGDPGGFSGDRAVSVSKTDTPKGTSQTYHGEISDSDEDDSNQDAELAVIKAKLTALQQTAKRYLTKQSAHRLETANPDSLPPASSHTDGAPTPNARKQLGKPAADSTWEEQGKLVVYTSQGVRASNQIAGFDLDGTIITTKSGKVFAKDAGDWRIAYPEVPQTLKKLHSDGYKIVLFTNQLGIGKGKLKLADFKRKVLGVQSKLGIPIQTLIATGEGVYRKPLTGMWTHLCNHGNDDIQVDTASSKYIGDAAGRPADWAPKKKKDFSCSDRLFALNVGVSFYTPEEFFLGQKKTCFNLPDFDPRKLPSRGPLLVPAEAQIPAQGHPKEVIVLVGFPASGKSSFVKKHLLPHKYVHINRDTMGTWQKCVAATESALVKGHSVVVDNTNPDAESRQRYTACARKAGAHCRCFVFNVSMSHARHNEKFRRMTDSGKSHAQINEMVFHSYKKKYTEPTTDEGFDAVVNVNFLPSFSNTKEESLYRMFLLEK